MDNCSSVGNNGCALHSGVISAKVALSMCTFAKTLPIRTKGGKRSLSSFSKTNAEHWSSRLLDLASSRLTDSTDN